MLEFALALSSFRVCSFLHRTKPFLFRQFSDGFRDSIFSFSGHPSYPGSGKVVPVQQKAGPTSPELLTIFLYLLLVGDLQDPSVDEIRQRRQGPLFRYGLCGRGREKAGKPKITDVLPPVKAMR